MNHSKLTLLKVGWPTVFSVSIIIFVFCFFLNKTRLLYYILSIPEKIFIHKMLRVRSSQAVTLQHSILYVHWKETYLIKQIPSFKSLRSCPISSLSHGTLHFLPYLLVCKSISNFRTLQNLSLYSPCLCWNPFHSLISFWVYCTYYNFLVHGPIKCLFPIFRVMWDTMGKLFSCFRNQKELTTLMLQTQWICINF